MSQLERVEMIHPDLPGQPYLAPKQAVGHLQRAGWQLAEESPPDPPSAPEPPIEAPANAGASSLETDQPPTRRRAPKQEGE